MSRESNPARSYQLLTPGQSHLSEPAHRETYESAHSVVLSILVLHAQRVGDGSGAVKIDNTLERPFAERIVPFYVNCLLEVLAFQFCLGQY